MKAVICAAVLAAACLNSPANTLKGSDDCGFFAVQIGLLGNQRDSGKPWVEVKTWLDEALKESRGQPGSIVNDDEDEAYIRATVESVWHGPLRVLSGHELIAKVAQDCRSAKVRTFRNSV